MQKNISLRIFWICLLFGTLTCQSATIRTKEFLQNHQVKTDSSQLKVRKIDSVAIEQYSKQKDFTYKDLSPQRLSLWQKFWRWFWNLIERIFSGRSTDTGFLKVLFVVIKYLLITLTIGLIIFIVLKLWGVDLKIFSGNSKKIDIPYHETLENIHEINFEDQIEAALQQSNYRLAVRLLYLKSLKQLSDRSLIDWLPDKTNKAYVTELQDAQQRAEFSILTYQFEYIWYGEFHIDKNGFENIRQSFQHFNRKKA